MYPNQKKDAELLVNKAAKEVVWDFYRSPINSKIGGSQALLSQLAQKYALHLHTTIDTLQLAYFRGSGWLLMIGLEG